MGYCAAAACRDQHFQFRLPLQGPVRQLVAIHLARHHNVAEKKMDKHSTRDDLFSCPSVLSFDYLITEVCQAARGELANPGFVLDNQYRFRTAWQAL